MKSAATLIMLGLAAGCTQSQTISAVTAETEKELCIQWRDSLPTRSRQDTERTQQEIGYAYDVQAVVCPTWARFP
jgi:hypothetical protein